MRGFSCEQTLLQRVVSGRCMRFSDPRLTSGCPPPPAVSISSLRCSFLQDNDIKRKPTSPTLPSNPSPSNTSLSKPSVLSTGHFIKTARAIKHCSAKSDRLQDCQTESSSRGPHSSHKHTVATTSFARGLRRRMDFSGCLLYIIYLY